MKTGYQPAVFDSTAPDADLIVQPGDTDLRILIRADGPQAPSQYRFDFDLCPWPCESPRWWPAKVPALM